MKSKAVVQCNILKHLLAKTYLQTYVNLLKKQIGIIKRDKQRPKKKSL